jgi:hypothetical protein
VVAPIAPPAVDTGNAPTHEDGVGNLGRRVLLGVAGIAGVAALSKLAKAGELSPPPGAISPTGISLTELGSKTGQLQAALDQVSHKVSPFTQGIAEPRTPLDACPVGPDGSIHITQPGAYCFTHDYIQTAGVPLVVVDCDDVSIDGQGFTVTGAPPGSPPSSCITGSGRTNIEILDLSISGWQGCPIDCNDCDDVDVSDCMFHACSCPPLQNGDGTVSPGSMIRCQDGACIYDVDFTSCIGCTVRRRRKGHAESCEFRACSGPAFVCADGCEFTDIAIADHSSPNEPMIQCGNECSIDDVAFTDCTGSALSTQSNCCVECISVTNCSSSGAMMSFGVDCSLCDFTGRVCTCPPGYYVSSSRCVCEDGCLTQITGDCIVCADECFVGDVQLAGCTGRGVSGGLGAMVEDVSFHDHQGDCVTVLDNGAVCDIECRSCTGVAITCGTGACVEEVAISNHNGDCVRCADGSCVTEVECRNVVGVCISVGKSSLIEDCDASGGGGGGSYQALEGSRVTHNRSHSRDDSNDIAVTDRCFVGDNIIGNGVGISCGSECCVEDNQLTQCNGKADSSAGVGGAIVVTGVHSSVSDNQLTNCRVAISVQGGAHFCSVDDNHISSDVPPNPAGAVAGIVVSPAAARVLCTCNHLRVAAGSPPFIAGSSSYGPLVSLDPAGGDISSQPSSAHHLANYIIS